MPSGNSPFAIVQGLVYNDANGNGKLDPGEKPLADLGIDLASRGGARYGGGSGSDGKFYIRNVPPGTYHLSPSYFAELPGPGHWIVTAGNYDQVVLRPSQLFGAVFLLTYVPPLGSITFGVIYTDGPGVTDLAKVYLDLNDNDKLDPGEPYALSTGSFTQLKAGTYVVRIVTAPGWAQSSPANNAPLILTVASGQDVFASFRVYKIGD
jgi:hypothetical protein